MDESLNEEVELYRMVLDNALDALIVTDEKANYLYTSPSMERLFGYKQDELIGRNAFELFHPEDLSVNKERLDMLLKGKEFTSIEFRFRKKNGDYVWCELTVKLVQTTKGDRRIVVVAREIAERKNLEGKLKEYSENLEELVAQRNAELYQTKEHLQQLVSRLPLALVSWDKEFKIKTWNPAATQIFGFSKSEALGKNLENLFPLKNGPSKVSEIWDQIQKGETTNVLMKNLTKDGRTIICAWTNAPLKDDCCNLDGAVSMIQDVTEKKKLEERLREITYSLSGVKAGESYLVGSLQRCLKIAFDLNSHGVRSLCIVRENPDVLVEDYNFKHENIVLLSHRPIGEFKAVNDLQKVAILITKFLKKGGGVVVLGGLEYLISRYGFNAVFMLIQEKRFEFLGAGSTLLVPVNLETLDSREKGLLGSELKLLE